MEWVFEVRGEEVVEVVEGLVARGGVRSLFELFGRIVLRVGGPVGREPAE